MMSSSCCRSGPARPAVLFIWILRPAFLIVAAPPACTVTQPELNSKPSKSARKREQHALQSLGERLIELAPEQLESMNLDERLLDAVVAAKSIRAHGALRRQKQLIGKLMRQQDPEPIRAALNAFHRDDRREKALFREAESWRDRITGDDGGALAAFFEHIGHDNEALAIELRQFRSATYDKARKTARRRIFREIHREIANRVQKDAGSI